MTPDAKANDDKAIVEREDALPDLPRHDEFDPLGTLLPSERRIPRRKLKNSPTKFADAAPFVDSLTGEEILAAQVVILRRTTSRILWDKGDLSAAPICQSDDARVPRESVQWERGVTGPTCKECPCSNWGSARGPSGEERKGQACTEYMNLLCFDLGREVAFIYSPHGLGLDPWARFVSDMSQRARPIYAYEITLTSRFEDRGTGASAYVPVFGTPRPLPKDKALAMRALIGELRDLDIGTEDEAAAAESDEPENPFE